MGKVNSPRQKAFEILLKIHNSKAYSNLTLDTYLQKDNIELRDKAFISALVYGVCERQLTLDFNLSKYLKQPIKKLKPEVLTTLRLGAYQLLFMDKIPPSAAINESVNLTKFNKSSFASGLVNAVLRNVSRNGLVLPEEKDDSYLSIKYSCPKWLVDMWINAYGMENTEKILSLSLGEVPVYLRVNTLKTTSDELISKLAEEGVFAEKCECVNNALVLKKQGSIEVLKAFKDGLFHVQDLSSQLCCSALGAQEGETVLDVCSAPGGKAFTICEYMNSKGKFTACDIYPSRVKLIEDGAKRLSIDSIATAVSDASLFNDKLGLYDNVLCDVPCSGLGIIRRKPEIKYKSQDDIDKLHNLQYLILCITARYVKKGGKLVYSTCSLNPNENTSVVREFLKKNNDFVLCEIPNSEKFGIVDDKMLTVMPYMNDSDGFFIALMERKGE